MNRFNTGNKALDIMLKFACSLVAAIMASAVCGALIWAIWDFSPFSAYAVEGSGGGSSSEDVVLTPQQTVALYGSTINGVYWDEVNHLYRNILFEYAYPLKSIGFMDSGGGFSGLSSGIGPSSVLNYCKGIDGCVYVASSSQWGGGTFPTYANRDSGGDPVNLNLTFSIQIPCTRFTQAVFWSTGYYNSKLDTYGSTLFRRNDTFWKCILANSELVPSGNAQVGGSTSTSSVPAHPVMPFYPFYSSSAMDESRSPYWSLFYQDISTGSDMVISGFQYGMQSLQQTIHTSDSVPPSGDVAIIIGCPTIHSYNPETVTTSPVVTTRRPTTSTTRVTGQGAVSYVTGEPVDLSNIESGIAEIIRQEQEQNWKLEWIGENAGRAVDNLALICDKLDAIYDLMVQQGELPTTDVSEDFAAWFAGALETHTTARIPDEAVDGLNFLSYLFSRLSAITWLVALGGLGLATGAASWIIFKGRGG